ncbi:MAG: hypothetical protein ACJ79R_17635, partial [Anaeromyxobacteraceae bacterium]
SPGSVAFDGTYVWVVSSPNSLSTLTKLKASDGTIVGTFALPAAPVQLAFDGANVWVSGIHYNPLPVTAVRKM